MAVPAGLPKVAVNGVSYKTWLQRKRANPKMKDNTWQGYLNYTSRARNEKAAARNAKSSQAFGQSYFQIDPNKYMKQFRAMLPQNPQYNPLTPGQLNQQARSAIMPLYTAQMDELTKAIQERSQRGSAAIQGYTNAYLGTLPQVQQNIGNIWGEARNLQAASSGALGDFMRNQGTTLSAELAQAEQAAGQTNAGSTMVGQVGAGSANAAAANDWSTMARLINQGAAAQQYGASLPAIAGAYGADTMRSFQSDLNQDLSSGLADLRTRGSQDILSMYQTLLDREMQKAGLRDQRSQAIAGAYGDVVSGNLDRAMAGAAMAAQFAQQAEGFSQDQIAATMYPDVPPAPTPGYDAEGNPILTPKQKWQAKWAEVSGPIAGALIQRAQAMLAGRPGEAAQLPANAYGLLLQQALAMVRTQMAGFGFNEGQLRGFARRALKEAGIEPPAAAQKSKAKPKAKPKPRPPEAGRPGGPPKRPSATIQGPGGSRIRIPGLPFDIPGLG